MRNLDFLIRKARKLLEIIPPSKHRHITFLLIRRRVMSVGWSKAFKTHPMGRKYGTRFDSIHSELDAILNFEFPPYVLHNVTMVNMRFSMDGKMSMSKPCEKCQKLISDFGIKEVYFTNRDGHFERF
jgi:deoxycytidylate deaminase